MTSKDSEVKQVGMLSLGCAKNLVDSEVMLGRLKRDGYALTPDAEEADVIIVNTCGFIDAAKEESIDAILEMAERKKQGRLQKLIVAGCLSQRYHQELSNEIPEVDAFIGINQVGQINDFIGERREVDSWSPDFLATADDRRVLTTSPHSAYVKISEGCNHECSFCIIPNLRGRHRSRTIEDIEREVRRLGDQGVREINLVAQDSTWYGRDLGIRDGLAQLLQRLVQIPTIAWIRTHYMYPYQVSKRLLKVMADSAKICPYLDIPLQHADRGVLAAMKRGSGRPQLDRFLQTLKAALPGAFIRSSFIVGFPNEDEDAFETLCDFVSDQRLDYLGVFTYSHEEGTGAFGLEDRVPDEVKQARKEHLLNMQREISEQKLADLVGRQMEVLVEGPHPETDLLLRGRHAGQAPEVDGEVMITEGKYAAGDIIMATIEESFDYDLAGRVIGGMEV